METMILGALLSNVVEYVGSTLLPRSGLAATPRHRRDHKQASAISPKTKVTCILHAPPHSKSAQQDPATSSTMVYIRQDKLPKLKEYKYSAVDHSLLSRYVLKPFYTHVVIKCFPMWMA